MYNYNMLTNEVSKIYIIYVIYCSVILSASIYSLIPDSLGRIYVFIDVQITIELWYTETSLR